MIGLFKKKEQNIKLDLSNFFNWIKNLDKQKFHYIDDGIKSFEKKP